MYAYLNLFPNQRVAVIGDLMLDCYLYGDVNRISPEAPVPVVRAMTEKVVAGGAANVVANLATLGLRVDVVGLTGSDSSHERLIACMRATGEVNCEGVIASARRRTTTKLRIIGAHQQMMRIDHEDAMPFDRAEAGRFLAAVSTAIRGADVVVLSDYGKGVFSDEVLRHAIDEARAAGKMVLVDPRRKDFTAYRGASILTPNRKELSDATGLACETDEEAALAAAKAREACGANILPTRSEKGMSFFPAGGPPLHMATVTQNVFDVSGAGDTVVAVLAASLAAGIAVPEAMRMANHAAGIVVSKLGTACVTRDELRASLAAEHANPGVDDGRLLDLEAAVALRWSWAREKLTVGVANGCFDLLHPGHVSLIRQASANCDRLIMALNSDDFVRRLKGPRRPLQNQEARATVMGAIKGVSAVVIFSEDTPLELISALQPDVLFKGADYSEDRVIGADIVRGRGGRVVLAGLAEGQSTSKLIAAAER